MTTTAARTQRSVPEFPRNHGPAGWPSAVTALREGIASPHAQCSAVGITSIASSDSRRDCCGAQVDAQVLQHLADSEVVWAWRMRLILAQDRPVITGYDQDLWAERLHYEDADPADALDTFAVLRRAKLRVLERASPQELKRVGVHAERGEESLEHLRRLYAGHDMVHLRQIERIRAGLR